MCGWWQAGRQAKNGRQARHGRKVWCMVVYGAAPRTRWCAQEARVMAGKVARCRTRHGNAEEGRQARRRKYEGANGAAGSVAYEREGGMSNAEIHSSAD